MNNSSRIYGFDALRAAAMWLGVLLHTIIFFKQVPEQTWPHDTQLFSPVLEFIYQLIHSFRMPLFFLVAGYFAGLVCDRKGLRVFIRQRAGRIVVPFVAGVIILVPLTLLPFHYFRLHYQDQLPSSEALSASLKLMLHWNGFAHLWFLYYLIAFSVISIGLVWLSRKKILPTTILHGKVKPALLLIVSFIVLFAIRYAFHYHDIPTYTGYKMPPGLFIFYAFFYFSGWIMYFGRFDFTSLFSFGTPLLIIAAISSVLLFGFTDLGLPPVASYALVTIQCLSLIYGCIALFIRYFNQNSDFWRYFSDSSYWVYLLHLGVAAGTEMLLHPLAINPWVKLLIVFLSTFIICVGSYHYLVSNSFIGKALNGKKIKRSGSLFSFLSVRKQKPQRAIPD